MWANPVTANPVTANPAMAKPATAEPVTPKPAVSESAPVEPVEPVLAQVAAVPTEIDSPTASPRKTDLGIGPDLAELEARVRKLESTVVAWQSKNGTETPSKNDNHLEERILAKVSEQLKANIPPPPPPEPAWRSEPPPMGSMGRPWLLVDLLRDAQSVGYMFFDRRFSISWMTKGILLLILAAVLTSNWWCPLSWIPGVGWLFTKLIDIPLLFIGFKILTREAHRYQGYR